MKASLLHKQSVPYGGLYQVNRPDIGLVGKGYTFLHLLDTVKAWRAANGWPNGLGLEEELEQLVCQLYAQECDFSDPLLPMKDRRTYSDIIRGTQVLLAFKLAGSPYVPAEEAQRRADICSKCSLCKAFPRPCGGLCGDLKVLVDQIIGPSGYVTSMDGDLRACAICSCYAGSQCRIPLSILDKGLTDEMRIQFKRASETIGCWKVTA